MRQTNVRAVIGWICAGVIGTGCLVAVASFGASLGSLLKEPQDSEPAVVIAAAFLDLDATLPAAENTLFVRPSAADDATLFSARPVIPADAMAAAGSLVPDVPSPIAGAPPAAAALPAAPPQAPARVAALKQPEPQNKAANPAPRRAAARTPNVLNDAQIASIKKRLNLTPDQERMWPAVEAALRDIVYNKNGLAARDGGLRAGGAMAYLDSDGPQVQRLKSAAMPLLFSLNEDQRREVKLLAHVMGLGGMASQF